MRLDRHDRPQVRRPELGDLDGGEPAVADAPHRRPRRRTTAGRRATRPRRSRRASPPRCTRRGRSRRTIRCRGRRPGRRRSRAARATSRGATSAFRRQLSLPYGIISRIAGNRSAGSAGPRPRQPQVGRQLDAVAGRDPGIPDGLDLVAGLARRSIGRCVWRRSSSAESTAGRRRPDAAARPVRRCRHGRPGPDRQRPMDPPVAPGRLREPVAHDLARRGHPTRRRAGDLRRRPFREPGGRASSSSTRTTGSSSSASIATRSTPGRGRSPRAACRPARPPLEGARRELLEETGVEAADWRELARVHLSNIVSDELAVLFLATGLIPRRRDARRDRGARGPLAAVRRGPGDDPRRTDHRRDDGRRRRASCALPAAPTAHP